MVRFSLIIILVQLLMVDSLLAEVVRLKLRHGVNLRIPNITGHSSVLETYDMLPAGSVVEIDSDRLNAPEMIRYRSGTITQSRNGFVGGVRVISLPDGHSDSDRFSNKTFYMSKTFLDRGKVLSRSQSQVRVRTRDTAPVATRTTPQPGNRDRDITPQREDRDITPSEQAAPAVQWAQSHNMQIASSRRRERITPNTASHLSNPNDPFMKVRLPAGLSERAIEFARQGYLKLKDDLGNKRYVTIIDYSKHSSEDRLFVFDLITGDVMKMKVAHGKNSDRNHDGKADSFSGQYGSLQTPLGFHIAAEIPSGKRHNGGRVLIEDGLEVANASTRKRGVYIHQARYVQDENESKSGRSWGCPAVDPDNLEKLITTITGGSLILHYDDSYQGPRFRDDTQIANILRPFRSDSDSYVMENTGTGTI